MTAVISTLDDLAKKAAIGAGQGHLTCSGFSGSILAHCRRHCRCRRQHDRMRARRPERRRPTRSRQPDRRDAERRPRPAAASWRCGSKFSRAGTPTGRNPGNRACRRPSTGRCRRFKAGPIQWPTPERFAVDPVVGYGYHDDVLLPVTIEVPEHLRSGTTVSLSAHVSWLACSDICIPEEADLRIAAAGRHCAPNPTRTWPQLLPRPEPGCRSANPFPTTATVAKNDDHPSCGGWRRDAPQRRGVLSGG